jgi:hypothetical protein
MDENIVVRINAPLKLWPSALRAVWFVITDFPGIETGRKNGKLVRTAGLQFYVWKTKTGYSVGHWEAATDG